VRFVGSLSVAPSNINRNPVLALANAVPETFPSAFRGSAILHCDPNALPDVRLARRAIRRSIM